MAKRPAAFGRIERWDDARGFGFIVPETPASGDPDRLFFHIRDYGADGARPTAGERVRFTPQRDDDGRWQAVRIASIPTPASHASGRAPTRTSTASASRTARPSGKRGIARSSKTASRGKTSNTSRRPPVARSARAGEAAGTSARGGLLTLGFVVSVWLGVLAAAISAGRLPTAALGVLAVLNGLAFVAFALDKHAARTGRWRTPEAHLHLLELLGGWPAAGLAQQVLRHKRAKPAYRRVYIAMIALHLLALVLWTFA
ncbi:DUF1294 domain-containing protein [Luteimonas abyssi]|uniref:DUF1294 domain-containing protein n=1 Tax=Luteimonas abyssi TaxID=1247514 RepID=UPI000737AF44|nr:DUF1294 domain-containing protein [Luteimonas abyssi]